MKTHWPLYRVLLASVTSYAVVALIHHSAWSPDFYRHLGFWAMFFLGLCAYYLSFEFLWHRFPMHYRFRFEKPKLLATFFRNARRSHGDHHATFHGKHFRSRDSARLLKVISPPYLFPMLFAIHYCVFRFVLVFPSAPLLAFLAGITWGYMLFETVHWCTHVPGTIFDRIMHSFMHVPVLSGAWWMWRYMQRHHHLHHERVDRNFNFSAPFPGDFVSGKFSPAPEYPEESED
jgi:hypothetical protein